MPAFAAILVVAVGVCVAGFARAEEPELGTTVRSGRVAPDGATTTRIDPAAFGAELRHAGELLSTSAGTALLDFGGGLSITTLTLRGGSADEVQILFDGVPLNASAGGGFDLSLIPGALLGGVEVQRGSDGARTGGGAMSGAVSLEPATGSRAVLTAGSLGTLGASASHVRETTGDSGLWRWTAAADVRRAAGDFAYHRDPTPELPANDPIDTFLRRNNDAVLGSALARVEHKTGEHTGWSALALVAAGDRGLAGPIYSPTPGQRQQTLTAVANVRGHWEAGGARGEAPVFVRGALFGGGGRFGDLTTAQRSLDVGLLPTAIWKLDELELELRGLGGLELFRGPLHGDRARLRGGVGAELARRKGRLTWTVAARADRWGDELALVPRAGVSFQPHGWLAVFANGSGGFRAPSFGELYFSGGPVVPNPDLAPERSWSGDAGLRLGRDASTLALSAFATRYTDVIIYEIYTGFSAKPFNVGQARALGLELEGKHAFTQGPLAGLSCAIAASRLSTTNLVAGTNTQGLALPYRPANRLVVRADWKRDAVRAGLELQATGEVFTNRANTFSTSGFADLRASVGLRLGPDLWLSAEVRNALDVTDRMAVDGYPLPGRVVLAHLSWEPAK